MNGGPINSPPYVRNPEGDKGGALDQQVGGTHYKNLRIQPAEFCYANNIGKLEGDVIAYVTRWRLKGGVEDLNKAKHTIDLIIALDQRYPPKITPQT